MRGSGDQKKEDKTAPHKKLKQENLGTGEQGNHGTREPINRGNWATRKLGNKGNQETEELKNQGTGKPGKPKQNMSHSEQF